MSTTIVSILKPILIAILFNAVMVSSTVAVLKDWKPAPTLPERAAIMPAKALPPPSKPVVKAMQPKVAPSIVAPKVGPPTTGNGYDANGVWQSNPAFYGASH